MPSVLFYESELFDDGGNPIPDGAAGISFRIRDGSGELLYEERQSADVVRGRVSALIGNGLLPSGAPTGGVPREALEPTSPRYLEVQVDGQPPTPMMEFASTPYALYSGVAHSVEDASIGIEALTKGAIDDIAAALSASSDSSQEMIVREDLQTMYRDPSAAALIGVAPGLNTSKADNIQGVLSDYDSKFGAVDSAASAEVSARSGADSALSNSIAAEVGARASADGALSNAIAAEAGTRAAEDAAIRAQLSVSQPQNMFNVRAWGRVVQCTGGGPSYSGGNVAGVSQAALTQCRVNFAASLASDYAVLLSGAASVPSRDAAGFTVACGSASGCPFDFAVVSQ